MPYQVNEAFQDSMVISAEGEVSFAPGTIIMTVVIPADVSLRSTRTIKEAVNLTRRYGALVETEHVPVPPE